MNSPPATTTTLRFAQALDLVDDPLLIADYEHAHKKIWPSVRDHLRSFGILEMEIYRLGTRLFMWVEADPAAYDAAVFAKASAASPVIQEWEALMAKYQQPAPWALPGEKWTPMQRIFSLLAQ